MRESIVLILALSSVGFSLCKGDDDISVEISQGKLEGLLEETLRGREFYSFYGIPYAKPPVGKRRFKDPEADDGWEGTLQAKTMPEYCKQISIFEEILGNSPFVGVEDCLYLNVFIPKMKKPFAVRHLPVMVFIHGGGFICGGAKEYSPKTLMDEDIILVIIQYRLGVFGFLSTEDSVIPGNFGLKDQTLALRWVKRNIEAFGGDQERITIFGESAGGASVHYQILTPWAKGLFKRAILQSGNSNLPWTHYEHHKKVAADMGKEINCTLENNSEDFLRCIQAADGTAMLKFVKKTFIFLLTPNYMSSRVDGDFLPEAAEVLIRDGKYNKVDVIAGITRDEGAGFLDFMSKEDADNIDKLLSTKLFLDHEEHQDEILAKIKDRYFRGKEISIEKSPEELIKLLGDRYNIIGHQVTMSFYIKNSGASVFLYELHQNPVISSIKIILDKEQKVSPWVAHGADLQFLFLGGGLFPPVDKHEDDELLTKYFVKFWTNFARIGNPTPDDSLGVSWEKSNSKMNFLAIKSQPEMAKNFRQEGVDWWTALPLKEFKLLGLSKGARDSSKNEL